MVKIKSLQKRVASLSKWIALIALMSIIVGTPILVGCKKPPTTFSGKIGQLEWHLEIETGTLTISGEGEMPDKFNDIDYPWNPYAHTIINVIVNGATTIGGRAFFYCDALVSVDMPKVTTIGSGAFQGCTALVSVSMPNVTTIGMGVFSGCTALTSVEMPNVTTIGEEAFEYCTSLVSVSMPNVTTIGFAAFYDCTALVSVEMPNVTTIDGMFFSFKGAFGYCTSLVSVSMPNVITIGFAAFYNCAALTSVAMPSVTTIGWYAFRDCNNLVSVTLSNRLGYVRDRAFAGCISLEHIYSYCAAPPKCEDEVFYDVPVSTCILHVPAVSVASYRSAVGWRAFTNIVEL